MTVPRVSMSGGGCSMADEDLKAVRGKASRLIGQAVAQGFGEFPIDHSSYGKGVLALFVEKNICAVLTKDSGATPRNHNKLRQEYRAEQLTESEALDRGVVARQIPLGKACPPDYDWCQSMAYNDVEDCDEVLDEINGYGMPTVMYAADGDAVRAQKYVDKLATAPLYTKYHDSGPVACEAGRDESGRRFKDSYHSLAVLFTSVEFVLRTFWGNGWTAWTGRRSCEDSNGKTLAADDLMFDFGMRVFVPVEVEKDGAVSQRFFVVTASAAAANGGLSSIVPDKVIQRVGYERFVGAEYAKKVLLDAFARGWEIKD
ncbi:MAG: hypothetical protein WC683_10675 [bacterium]